MRAALVIAAGFAALIALGYRDSATRTCGPVAAHSITGRLGLYERCHGGLTGVIEHDRLIVWLED